jgi:hypothetical protein
VLGSGGLDQSALLVGERVGRGLLGAHHRGQRPGAQLQDGERRWTGQPPCLLVGVGAQHRCGHHQVGLGQQAGGPEVGPVEIDRFVDQRRGEVEGEAERKAEQSGEAGAEGRGAEQPDLGEVSATGHRSRVGDGAVSIDQVLDQFDDVLGKVLGAQVGAAPEGPCRGGIGARGTPEAEIDPSGVEGLEGGELLGHHHGGVVRQHDPTGSHPKRGGGIGQVPDQHRRSGTGHGRHPMVFGDPHPVVAEGFDDAGQTGGVGQGIGRGSALCHRGQVEHRERRHDLVNTRLVRILPLPASTGQAVVTTCSIRSSVFAMLAAVFTGRPPSRSRNRWRS